MARPVITLSQNPFSPLARFALVEIDAAGAQTGNAFAPSKDADERDAILHDLADFHRNCKRRGNAARIARIVIA